MVLVRWAVWPVLLLPALWWAWQQAHAPPQALRLGNGAELVWGECWFERPWWRPVHCGRFHTAPVPGAQPQRFSLPVVYLPQYAWARRGPPVQYIAGGPGGAAWLDTDQAGFWLDWLDATDWPGDLVLYDQRGVGLSQPALSCPELRELRRELLPLPSQAEELYRRTQIATRACHDRLRADGIDLSRFTTRHNAADAVDLMRAMGLAQWDLYGVSYGTRVALEIMRGAPAELRAVVLDSPYPPQVNAELADAWLLQRALELFGRICELTDACSSSPDELNATLERALARVDRELLRISVPDPDDGGDLAVVYGDEDLAWLLFEAFYRWDVIPDLPAAVAALAEGRLDVTMRRLIEDSVAASLDDTISDPVAASVDCHDTAAIDQRAAQRQLERYPRVSAIKRHDWAYHACRFWSSGEASVDFQAPVHSDVPTLILAGEFDPVTPPEWAEQAAASLSRAEVLIFPAIGHGVLDSDLCAATVVRAFYADPRDPRPPACLGQL